MRHAALLIVALSCMAPGQVVVEEEVSTDTVNVFTPSQGTQKSASIAMMSSLLLPGLGHHYIDRPNHAMAFLMVEAAAVCGLIFSDRYAVKLNRDAAAYAIANGKATGGPEADERYWQMLGLYMGSREYNADMELNREPDRKYPLALSWRWADESVQDEYNSIREQSRRFRMASTFFLASMILNRAVAFVEVRASTRFKGIRSAASSVRFHPESAASSALGLSLNATF